VQRCWTKQGWQAAALDIKIGGSSHDILTKRGFLNFLDHIMMMLLGSVEHFLLLYVLFFLTHFTKPDLFDPQTKMSSGFQELFVLADHHAPFLYGFHAEPT
jgi:hypothetical protein